MLKKIVLMKNMKYGWDTVVIIDSVADEDHYQNHSEQVMLSEFIEVDFPELDKKEVIDAQIGSIEKQESKVTADYHVTMAAFKDQKQKLLAISHDK